MNLLARCPSRDRGGADHDSARGDGRQREPIHARLRLLADRKIRRRCGQPVRRSRSTPRLRTIRQTGCFVRLRRSGAGLPEPAPPRKDNPIPGGAILQAAEASRRCVRVCARPALGRDDPRRGALQTAACDPHLGTPRLHGCCPALLRNSRLNSSFRFPRSGFGPPLKRQPTLRIGADSESLQRGSSGRRTFRWITFGRTGPSANLRCRADDRKRGSKSPESGFRAAQRRGSPFAGSGSAADFKMPRPAICGRLPCFPAYRLIFEQSPDGDEPGRCPSAKQDADG